nr:MAG TPA: hypothetical protein [Bacteriophage sp.]
MLWHGFTSPVFYIIYNKPIDIILRVFSYCVLKCSCTINVPIIWYLIPRLIISFYIVANIF